MDASSSVHSCKHGAPSPATWLLLHVICSCIWQQGACRSMLCPLLWFQWFLCDVISVMFWSLCEIFEELNHIMITFSWASIFQGFRKHNLKSFAANHLKDLWWIEPRHHYLGAHTLPLFHGQEHILGFRKHHLESLLQTIWTFEWKELSIITIELLVYNWELVCDTKFCRLQHTDTSCTFLSKNGCHQTCFQFSE